MTLGRIFKRLNFFKFLKPDKSNYRTTKIAKNVRQHGRLDTVNPHLIEIGEGTIIGRNSQIITHCPVRPGPVKIGKYVFVGYGVTILPNTNIGDYALIGAGSVVTKDIAAYQIVAGNPAVPIRKRPKQSIDEHIQAIENGSNIGHISNREGLWMRESKDSKLRICINFNENGWCDMDLFPSNKCPCECYSPTDFHFHGKRTEGTITSNREDSLTITTRVHTSH